MSRSAQELLQEVLGLNARLLELEAKGADLTADELGDLENRGNEIGDSLPGEDQTVFYLYWKKDVSAKEDKPSMRLGLRARFMRDALKELTLVLKVRSQIDPLLDGVASKTIFPRPDGESPLILVVDDERDVRRMTVQCVQKWGCRTVEAEDGPTGLEKVVSEKPDLVLLDVMMPGMTGLEVLRKLRDKTDLEQLPIVLLTAVPLDPEQLAGSDLGASDYLQKPIAIKKLRERIQRLLMIAQARKNPAAYALTQEDLA